MSMRDRLMDDDIVNDQKPGYSTYVMGAAAVYNSALLKQLKENVSFGYCYISNWRVLHIDGFEDGYPSLPRSSGQGLYFTWNENFGGKTQDGAYEWTNCGRYDDQTTMPDRKA
jgi:hypothetical protein